MGHFFHYPYSDKLIQSTLDFWGPKYAERGEQLTRADAEEILRNLGGFFDTLWDMDQTQRKRTIENYYREKGVEVVGSLADDLKTNNFKALQHVEHAINHLADVPGLDEFLSDLAQITKTDNDGERIYHNNLTQLHAIGFVHKVLGCQVLEVESKSHPVLASRRVGKKSCDIHALLDGTDLYFECKDASSETLSQYQWKGATHYTPMGEEEIRAWIEQESRAADRKGADYLICRVPVWVSGWEETEQEFYDQWIRKVFEITAQPSKSEVTIAKLKNISGPFRGIYIIKTFGHLKLTFLNNPTMRDGGTKKIGAAAHKGITPSRSRR